MENMEQVIFQIILHDGNGRSASMEAIHSAKQGDFEGAREKLKVVSEINRVTNSSISYIIQELNISVMGAYINY
jgi:cellobiose PTS system EIIA component